MSDGEAPPCGGSVALNPRERGVGRPGPERRSAAERDDAQRGERALTEGGE